MKQTTIYRAKRNRLEQRVLEAYNTHRRKGHGISESYMNAAIEIKINTYQVQHIILKLRKEGKDVL